MFVVSGDGIDKGAVFIRWKQSSFAGAVEEKYSLRSIRIQDGMV